MADDWYTEGLKKYLIDHPPCVNDPSPAHVAFWEGYNGGKNPPKDDIERAGFEAGVEYRKKN